MRISDAQHSVQTIVTENVGRAFLAWTHHRLCGYGSDRTDMVSQATFPRETGKVP